MIWVVFAFMSAFFLGFYEICKKLSLNDNAVLPVLFLNSLMSSVLFLPFILLSQTTGCLDGTLFFVPPISWASHGLMFLKSVIVLSSWICGYFSIKHLPLTLTGPVKAAQPVLTLVGALLIFGERLNLYQWMGVSLAVLSLFLLSRSSRRDGKKSDNRWFVLAIMSIVFGSMSGLYDKYLMRSFDVMTVQVWFNVYQLLLMTLITGLLWYPHRRRSTPFSWRWSIVAIPVLLAVGDWLYFYSLSMPGAMISIVSMIRRSNVLISFTAGAFFFHEKHLKSKAFDLLLVVIGMLFLWWGTR